MSPDKYRECVRFLADEMIRAQDSGDADRIEGTSMATLAFLQTVSPDSGDEEGSEG